MTEKGGGGATKAVLASILAMASLREKKGRSVKIDTTLAKEAQLKKLQAELKQPLSKRKQRKRRGKK